MNKLLALLLLIISTAANAQGFTFGWNGGFAGQPGNQNIPALAINTQTPTIDQWTNLANVSDLTRNNIPVHSSYGQGFNIGMKIGYMFTRYIGINLGVTYTGSSNISATQIRTLYLPDSLGDIQPSGGYLNCQLSTQSRSITLSPSVIGTYEIPKSKFAPYARAGLVLPVWTQITHNTTMSMVGISSFGLDSGPYYLGTHTNVTIQTKGAFAMGFNGAVGVTYKANPFLSLFAEINGQYLKLKGTQSNITQWTADGIDLTLNRVAYRQQFNYVNNLSSTSNNAAYNSNYDPNSAKQELSPVFPFSNIGFNVGVQLFLNTKIFKDKDAFEETRKRKVKKKPKTEDTGTTDAPAATDKKQ